MLGFHFVFAIAASYYLCASGQEASEVSCWERQQAECDDNFHLREFPTTVDELRDGCSYVKNLGACILKVRDSCSEDKDFLIRFRETLDYIHSVCREDSEIFQVISNNIECIAAASEDAFESCDRLSFSDPTKEIIMNALHEHIEKYRNQSSGYDAPCFDSMWRAYCPSIKVGVKCGFDVAVAVKDIITHMDNNKQCTEEAVAELTPAFEIIELAILQEELLKKMEEEETEAAEEGARRKRRFASPLQSFRDKILLK